NNVGDTPMHVASWKNHAEVVQILIENGADKRIRNEDNKTPLDLTHDPAVRSFLEDKVIFSNYKQRKTQQGEDGNDDNDDSD
ncbi:unnamed protein product, partial [Rotaria magnacalcarata]